MHSLQFTVCGLSLVQLPLVVVCEVSQLPHQLLFHEHGL